MWEYRKAAVRTINISMKLTHVKPVYEAFEADFATNSRKRLSDTHFDLAFNAVKKEELDFSEIKELAKEVQEHESYDRTVGSAIFVLTRMHILIHGSAPYGLTEKSAETFFQPSGPMNKFAEAKGIDVGENVRRARIDLKNRTPKITNAEAGSMVAQWWKENKERLGHMRDAILRAKDEIISDVMAGLTPDEAANRHITESVTLRSWIRNHK